MTWQPASTAPADRPVWGLIESRNEVWPLQLGTAVGKGDQRLAQYADHRFFIHAKGGHGVFVRWWREIELPEENR